MDFLFVIHRHMRWVVALAGVAALGRMAAGWALRSTYTALDRVLATSFGHIVALQLLLGYTFLAWSGLAGAGFPRARLEHAFTMTVAAVLAQLPVLWKGAADSARFRNTTVSHAIVLALIFAGVVQLRGGWIW